MPPLSAYEVQDPSCIAEHLPPVIRPLPATPRDPQNVVSATLDRIVDVRERMNDVEKNGGMGCSVEKQQLKVELNIVSRQIQVPFFYQLVVACWMLLWVAIKKIKAKVKVPLRH